MRALRTKKEESSEQSISSSRFLLWAYALEDCLAVVAQVIRDRDYGGVLYDGRDERCLVDLRDGP